ncbi:snurportin1 domain-containing protein [Ditylenchus destructor]|uniref:Snurportin-1 n=1 Tax=Ditylenchus destructor TaxID=166010 RepID=A0AAD4RBB4_9BILA|nr:snurportin1 domain-containing protein [Ditylenchus destructor]
MDSIDKLTSELSTSMAVSENNVYDEHPHFSKYKNIDKLSEKQRNRREEFLEKQSNARDQFLNRFRDLYDPGFDDGDTSAQSPSPMETGESAGGETGKRKRRSHGKGGFADCLMLSEWLIDIPATLSKEWIMVPCPVGKRVIVVAKRGETKAYNKGGRLIATFKSDLPGGGPSERAGCTMLDCIMKTNTLYALDLLIWKDNPYTASDFPCRRFVLQSRLEEMPQTLASKSYKFVTLPQCPCTVEDMTQLMKTEFDFELDGLLFYFSEAFYTPGQTPLVGWLKPFMLTEILGVQFIDKYNKDHNFKSSIKPAATE